MKRGQITTFAILGIVLVAAVLLVLYLRGQFFFGPVTPETLGDRLQGIDEHVTTCVQEVAPDYIKRIGLQGGHLNTPKDTYRLRQDIPVSYLCHNIPGSATCSNRLLLRSDMETELENAIDQALAGCIDLSKFGKGYELATSGRRKTNVTIGDDVVTVDVYMPVVLRKEDVQIDEDTFTTNFNYPLGRLYEASQDIINMEAEFGEFDQLSYMLAKQGQYIIEKDRPYPDKLYMLRTNNNDYLFQFFIEGEPN